MKLIYTFILLSFVFSLNAQVNKTSKRKIIEIEKEKKDFENNFFEDFEANFEEDNTNYLVNTTPCYIPSWLFNVPKSTNDYIYAIGISDPGMDSADAIQLASVRAKSIVALLNNSNIRNVTDFYSNLKSNANENMFEYYSQILASRKVSNDSIINSFYTKYDEAVVLLRIPTNIINSDDYDFITMDCKLYKMDMNMEYATQYEAMFEIDANKYNEDTCFTSHYILTEVNNNVDILTEYMDNKISIPNYYFNYKIFVNDSNSNQLSADNGLWKEYIKSILLKVLNLSQINSVKVKTMRENYSSIYEKMTREVSNNNLQFDIDNIQVIDNRLKVGISICPDN
ncbi:MAG: hypothetical protein DRJ01_00800 [Bacteroidetes bacterium]|nr:MAG: hypothetical protein DRJ01_00800 [Bacteroidota bacterium]